MEFNPRKMKALAEGIELLASARTHLELSQDAIFTSVDVEKAGQHPDLCVTNIPSGFRKTMLPFFTVFELIAADEQITALFPLYNLNTFS